MKKILIVSGLLAMSVGVFFLTQVIRVEGHEASDPQLLGGTV